MRSCGYACGTYLIKKYKRVRIKENDKGEYSILELIGFLNKYQLESVGYEANFEKLEGDMIIHLNYGNFNHFVVLIKKGILCLVYDNLGYHLIPQKWLSFLFSGYLIKLSETNK